MTTTPTRTFERRVFPVADAKILRADDRTGSLKFQGRPWVYGQMSDDLGGWNEVMSPGAATRTLAKNPDVRFLVNHDSNLLLARTTSGTLTLSEDDEGGIAVADMANVSYARDLAVLIERGDLTQMSFGFWIVSDEWAGNLHRVHEFDLDGGDVSAVTFPAYPQTSSELRSRAEAAIERTTPGEATPPPTGLLAERGAVRTALEGLADQRAVERALIELREGKVLSAANRELVSKARDALTDLLDKTAPAAERGNGDHYPHRMRVFEALASL